MIANFPVPQKGELLSSILARFVARHGLESHKVSLDLLFGDRKIVTSALFQGRINLLLERVGHLWDTSSEDVIYQHTMLPLFAPFLPPEQIRKMIQDISFQKANSVSLRSGMNASLLNWRENYMICRHCWELDKQKLGFNYWHRAHQAPGIGCCSIHQCDLVDSGKSMQHTQRHGFVLPQIDRESIKPFSEKKSDRKLLILSNLVMQLFELSSGGSKFRGISSEKWSGFYSRYAANNGLMNGGRINHGLIEHLVMSYWGKKWLEQNDLLFVGESNWLRRLFQKHRRGFSYLQHFVVWLAIEQKPINIFERLTLVQSIQKNEKNKKPISTKIDAQKVREKWLGLRQKQPQASLKMLRAMEDGKRLYIWLYRHDKEWLDVNKPTRVLNYVNSRVNWQERDNKLVRQLMKILLNNELELMGPRRSRSWYANQLGIKSMVEKHLDKLPKVHLFFSKYSETVEEYQCRRLSRVVAELISKNNQLISVCEVERIAGLSEKRKSEAARLIISESLSAWQVF